MTESINFNDDRISVSDITDRLEELEDIPVSEEDRQHYSLGDEAGITLGELTDEQLGTIGGEFGDDDATELKLLKEVLEELSGNGGDEQFRGDWYPSELINEHHFQTYAQEFADEIGAINSEASWPNNCIDWEQAANDLRSDYTAIDIEGHSFLYR